MATRPLNTHRRQMRPVTPVTRVGRGTAGVAIAATFVLAGSTSALADGTNVDAAGDAQEAATLVPATSPAVTIPVVESDAANAYGTFALEGVSLTPQAPVEVEPEEEAEEAVAQDAGNDSQRSSDRSDSTTSNSASRETTRERSRSNSDSSRRSNSDSNSRTERTASSSRSTSNESQKPAKTGESKKSDSGSRAVAGNSIIATAMNGIGVPYVSGGSTPSGWDCSGFVHWVYAQHGVNLPRTSGAQAAYGTRISRSEARPGDLVYTPGHIGIYAGNGKIIDAGNRRVDTTKRNLWSANWTFYRVG